MITHNYILQEEGWDSFNIFQYLEILQMLLAHCSRFANKKTGVIFFPAKIVRDSGVFPLQT